MKINIPDDVNLIIKTLQNSGFEGYVVGGCVRDSILGIEPNDWDITTSAKPDEIKRCFSGYQLTDIGENHGTIGVVINNIVYEITTYRIDGNYEDNRHPSSVEFTANLVEDLSRRDFTVNAIAYNAESGLVDPFDGVRDIQLNAIRCVGDSDVRFKEDALRILRAIRFASTYNFSIEVYTATSIIKNRLLLNNVSEERINAEFSKLLCGDNVGYVLRRYKDVISVFLPELVSTFDFEQNNPYHNKTVWKHTTVAVANIENDLLLRMVMLLHDIGKPLALRSDRNGVDHFDGHSHFSAMIAQSALERLKYPNNFISDVVILIEYHDIEIEGTKRQVKYILNKIGKDNFAKLLAVKRADILSKSNYKRENQLNNIKIAQEIFEEIITNNECYQLKDLSINGSDLIHLGITNGVEIGEILYSLLADVINEEVDNDSVLLKKLALQLHNDYLNKEADN